MTREEPLHSFKKNERLLRREEFLRVSREGWRVAGRHFIVIRLPRSNSPAKIGITASRKVGGAVVRNHIKRLVRECYRLNKKWFQSADYSIIARSSAAHLDLGGVCNDLVRTLRQFKAEHG
ncbi:ribonuclease P protein component [Geobacter pelophilus]|uniref:Ribonuclease P protein component n=1 Tax=Geoanaerobacter pelophilus TaxID=60036 RepID=A0AAW4L922_9BACT|nr:ribonuclease P protein component [Geoanaerobacter pelophilus]